jgi:Tol biopolymer transport system component
MPVLIQAFLVIAVLLLVLDKRKQGNPLDNLPDNITVLTYFGERADFSPDNKKVAFMSKSFGDAMIIDLETRAVKCLTCNVPGAVFLRVMHLRNGDFLLIGPEYFENISTSRDRDNELWYLKNERGAKPVKLNQKMSEGAAISKTGMTIAFAVTHEQDPSMSDGSSKIIRADIDISGDQPALINNETVFLSEGRDCVLEAQDFYDHDQKLTFTCYEPGPTAAVYSLDLNTGIATNMSNDPGRYHEVEGIFPGGAYTCVESDKQCEWLAGEPGSGNIDIWKLRLDGTGEDFVRLTQFNDFVGGKASNPVISSDGRYMAFQSAKTTDPAGVGYGILLYELIKN